MTAAPGPRSRRPRAAANYGPQRGTTYLIHIDPPYKHAKHYKGWTPRPVGQRFADHLAGRGALLTRMAVQAGSRLTLARVWPDTTKDREDSIKRQDGKRICPECGVKPAAPRLASDKPPEPVDRRPMWMADRDGQWDDGTPIIFDPDQTWAQARAIRAAMQIPEPDPAAQAELAALDELQRQWTNQEEQVGLKETIGDIRFAVWTQTKGRLMVARAKREGRPPWRQMNADADRLGALADLLDKQMGRQPGYQHELTTERAARIRALVGEDLARDAHIEAMPQAEGQPLDHWAITPDDVAQAGRGPVLQGADLDAAIDALAEAFPEPDRPEEGGEPGRRMPYGDVAPDWIPAPDNVRLPTWDRYTATEPGSDEHKAAYAEMHREAGGEGFPHTDPDRSYMADHGYETDADRFRTPEPGPGDAPLQPEVWGATAPEVEAPGEEPGADAATWSPALEDATVARAADRLASARAATREAWEALPDTAPALDGPLTPLENATVDEMVARTGFYAALDAQEAAQGSDGLAVRPAAAPDYYRSEPGTPDHRADYMAMHARDRGVGYADPDADVSYGIDNAAELAQERYYDDPAAYYGVSDAELDVEPEPARGSPAPSTGDLWNREVERARQHLERWTAEHGPDGGYAESLRQDVARYEQWAGEARASAQPATERMSPESDHSPEPAPGAATQPAGTPHTDPALAERGGQADPHGVYTRNPDAEAPGAHFGRGPGEPVDAARWAPLTRAEAAERDPDLAEIFDRAEELAAEAGAYETAANLQVEAGDETGAPDHLYGSPECVEAGPEGAHFGQLPGEPQDTGRWPVLQADYGRMYIGPQAQAEAV